MGVIGIVSALTLPNLNSSTGDKQTIARVKKIYQNLQDAFGRAEAVYGPYSDWFVNDPDDAKFKRQCERISEFMKLSKQCTKNSNNFYEIETADGTYIEFDGVNAAGAIAVDVDGKTKGPNRAAKDVFFFDMYNDIGIVPSYYNKTFAEILDKVQGGKSSAYWIINYDNMDYLKFQSVSGSTATCKNGNTVTESHPRCK